MYKQFFFLISFIRSQDEYIDFKTIDTKKYKDFIATAKSSRIYKFYLNYNIFDYIENKYEETFKDFSKCNSSNGFHMADNFIPSNFLKLIENIMNLIFNNENNECLLEFIFKTKLHQQTAPGSLSVISAFGLLCTHSILFFMFEEVHFLTTKDDFKEKLLGKTNIDTSRIFNLDASDKNIFKQDDDFFVKCIWETMLMQAIKHIQKYCEKLEISYTQEQQTRQKNNMIPRINSIFYKKINEEITKLMFKYNNKRFFSHLGNVISSTNNRSKKDDTKDIFYLLLHKEGFASNRISMNNDAYLYINEKSRTFKFLENYEKTSASEVEYDLTYIEGKTFKFKTCLEFEFFMGLLQFIAESQSKEIICSYERNTYNITVIRTSPDIPFTLQIYKAKNNITNKFLNDMKKNKSKYEYKSFTTIVDFKEYFFVYKEGYETVHSKCLKLSCSHIIGRELLEEFYSSRSSKCFYCNIKVEVVGYLEINLYTKPE